MLYIKERLNTAERSDNYEHLLATNCPTKYTMQTWTELKGGTVLGLQLKTELPDPNNAQNQQTEVRESRT